LIPRIEKSTVIKRSGNVHDEGSIPISSSIYYQNQISIVKKSHGQTDPPLGF
jgi:hypothetical protein